MAALETTGDRAAALRCLGRDPFSHLMSLKMLTLYPGACTTTTFLREGWACATRMEAAASPWDRLCYPKYPRIVMIDGDTDELLRLAFESSPGVGTVFKVHDPFTESLVQALPGTSRVRRYLNYSTPEGYRASPGTTSVVESDRLTPEAIRMFAENGYSSGELEEHFRHGATWFGLSVGGLCVSACFVFRNFGRIWEIAGVYSVPEHRRRGHAASVVRATLVRLLGSQRIPRYQLREDNAPSRALAEGLGLRHVLTVSHYTTAVAP